MLCSVNSKRQANSSTINEVHIATPPGLSTQTLDERKERNVLFNDALNTFGFLMLIRHIAKELFRQQERKQTATTKWATLSV